MDLRDLYEEVILDHNRNPRNYPKRPASATNSAQGHNPLCGDEVTVHIAVEDGRIKDVGFEGRGCAISTASASLMTEAIMGMSEQEAAALFERIHALLVVDDVDDREADTVGKLAVLLGVRDFPMRVKCATLPWHTLQAALEGSTQPVTTE